MRGRSSGLCLVTIIKDLKIKLKELYHASTRRPYQKKGGHVAPSKAYVHRRRFVVGVVRRSLPSNLLCYKRQSSGISVHQNAYRILMKYFDKVLALGPVVWPHTDNTISYVCKYKVLF